MREKKKRAGRKPLRENDPSVNLVVRVPGTQMEKIQDRARAMKMTLANFVRHWLPGGD